MSEYVPSSPEHEKHPQHHKTAEHSTQHHEKKPEVYEQERKDMLEQAQRTIEKQALPEKDVPVEIQHEAPKQLFVNQELKAISFQRTLSRTRKQLSKPERSLSKVIHQPVVDSLSRIGEKTIARPSALFAGGLGALLGSSIMLYMAKHYGFRYNLFVFIALFGAGFVVGLVIEFLLGIGRRSRSRTH